MAERRPRDRKVASGGGRGASPANPSVALSNEVHARINALQRKAGLYDKANLAKWTAREVIEKNADCMQQAGVRREVVQEVRKSSLRYASEHGQMSAKELAEIAENEGWGRTLDLGE